ncbi:MAG: AAA family ATPase [Magnetococcales bacterium]|nr:AAA family ATPase [Magnetococcales bacterium]NGZ25512.1 AAA family ATPase [Magnetococcales bacterium]
MITVIGNLKGGCGKSTVTFNLAIWLARAGVDVVAFDLDPQATLSDVAEVRQEDQVKPNIKVYRPDTDPEKVFREHADGEILVDVGASNLWAMRQAIRVSHRILVPVPPSQADVWATQRFLTMVDEALAKQNTRPKIFLFLNRADTHPGLMESDETADALKSLPGVEFIPHRLYQRTLYRRSFSEGRAVFELGPNQKAAEEIIGLAQFLYPDLPAAS